MSDRKTALHIILILSASILVYSNSINNGFTLDDRGYLVECDYIKDWRNLFAIFTPDYLKAPADKVDLNRPMMTWSLIVEYAFWGLNPSGYHTTNILLHALNSILLYIFLSSCFKDRRAAFLSSMIFAVHPIHTEAVNGINFREDLLMTSFYILSMFLFTKRLEQGGRHTLFYSTAILLSFISALLSKEMAVTLPLLLLILHYLHTKNLRLTISEGQWFYMGCIFVLLVYIAGLSFIYANTQLPRGHFFEGEGITVVPLLGRITAYYLRFLAFPFNMSIDHNIEASESFFEFLPLLSIVLLILLLLMSIKGFKKKPAFFPVMLLFITLIPVMATFYQQPLAERFLYLPSAGAAALFGTSLSLLIGTNKRGFTIYLCLFLTVAFYSAVTVSRNRVWGNDILLYQDALKASPKSQRVHFNLGKVYEEKGDFIAAVMEYQKALDKRPLALIIIDHDQTLTVMGMAYLKKGDHSNAISALQGALVYSPRNPWARYNLARAYYLAGHTNTAIFELNKVIALKPDLVPARMELAKIYVAEKEYQAAIREYRAVLNIAPRSFAARTAEGKIAELSERGFPFP